MEEPMPQASDYLRAQWPGGDQQAIAHLLERGYRATRGFCWVPPGDASPETYEPTDRDWSAMTYLIDEWDYGGLVSAAHAEKQRVESDEKKLERMLMQTNPKER